jgi:hypothetical protein
MEARVTQQGQSGIGQTDAKSLTGEQRHAHGLFHLLDSSTCGADREVHLRRAMRDTSRFCDSDKQPKIGDVKAHAD